MPELQESELLLLERAWQTADDDHGGCAKDVLALLATVRYWQRRASEIGDAFRAKIGELVAELDQRKAASAVPDQHDPRDAYVLMLIARAAEESDDDRFERCCARIERVLGLEHVVLTESILSSDDEPFTTMSGARLLARCPAPGCTAQLPSLADIRRHLEWHEAERKAAYPPVAPGDGWTPPAAAGEGSHVGR